MNFIDEFREAAAAAGVCIEGEILSDSRIHRFRTSDKTIPDNDGYYLLFSDGPPYCGIFGCWRRNIKVEWHSTNGEQPKGADWNQLRKKWREAELKRKKDESERHQRNAAKARDLIAQSHAPNPDHPYLQKKQVPCLGPLTENSDHELVLPLQDAEGVVWSLQTIDAVGDKLFMPGGRVQGCFYPLAIKETGPLIICEGYATGASLHQATGFSVICAMNCGNLPEVAKALRQKWPSRLLIIAADNDTKTEGNPGLTRATEAAKSAKASLAIPVFPSNGGSDFNDLAVQSGLDSVRTVLDSVVNAGLGSRMEIDALLAFQPEADHDVILGNRYLCRGGSCVIVGSTSVGKSSLGLQMAVLWAIGASFFGLKPVRPLKSLFLQAENDLGDMAEMFQGILKGTGLLHANNPDANAELVQILKENIIIKRDQTHSGPNFAPFARSLIEIHQPDIFWVDPLLSFYGNDIVDQKTMTTFLRGDLNPISEQTGILWILLHHTGKPAKDAAKTQKTWTSRDYAYLGLGSSELSNWARAIITLANAGEDEFKLVFAKRGWRSGVLDDSANPTTEIHIAHGGEFICWKRIPKPKEKDEMAAACQSFALTITTPTKASAIVRAAALKLKRGERTTWSFWDSGDGVLGSLFYRQSDGLWLPKKSSPTAPYKDD